MAPPRAAKLTPLAIVQQPQPSRVAAPGLGPQAALKPGCDGGQKFIHTASASWSSSLLGFWGTQQADGVRLSKLNSFAHAPCRYGTQSAPVHQCGTLADAHRTSLPLSCLLPLHMHPTDCAQIASSWIIQGKWPWVKILGNGFGFVCSGRAISRQISGDPNLV